MVEAGRPARASKRPGGKSDPADALRAARDALAADKLAQPRSDGAREGLRILLTARAQASTARTAAVNTLKALLLAAPDHLRQTLRGLSTPRQASRCRSLRAHASQPVAEQILRAELRRLAAHIGSWDRELPRQRRPAAPARRTGHARAPGPARSRADERRPAAGLLGPTPAGSAPRPPSPPSPAPARWKPPSGQDHPPPPQPLRRPPAQPRPARHRQLADTPRPPHPRLPRPPPRRDKRPNAKSAAASSATPPAASTASWRQPPGLDNL